MTTNPDAIQDCPPPEGPGLHSYPGATPPPPEQASAALWLTRPTPDVGDLEPEAGL